MKLRLPQIRQTKSPDLIRSKLLDQDSFYPTLHADLKRCKRELIIESAFVSTKRIRELLPTLDKLKSRGVRIAINTRDPRSTDIEFFREDSLEAISKLQHAGIQVMYTGKHHRKLVIIDRELLYEGSLNILSQKNSCEVMRRIESKTLAEEMLKFVDKSGLCYGKGETK